MLNSDFQFFVIQSDEKNTVSIAGFLVERDAETFAGKSRARWPGLTFTVLSVPQIDAMQEFEDTREANRTVAQIRLATG